MKNVIISLAMLAAVIALAFFGASLGTPGGNGIASDDYRTAAGGE